MTRDPKKGLQAPIVTPNTLWTTDDHAHTVASHLRSIQTLNLHAMTQLEMDALMMRDGVARSVQFQQKRTSSLI